MAIERSWIERFYSECGRELTLAYSTFNQTNNWGITLTTGIVGIVFISAMQSVEGKITFTYPSIPHWFAIILAWAIMTRFFVRSCLALVNMYRWNTLIYAASKLLSLRTDHPAAQIFERNFAKKTQAYFYDWHSPIRLAKLVWECFRLMYVWFFLILFGLILWGSAALYDQPLWPAGLLVFVLPTAWEIYSLLTWRGFRYERLALEEEPDIAALWLDGSEARSSPTVMTSEPRNGMLRKHAIAQALTYFFFGLLSILAFHISRSRGLPVILPSDILGTIIDTLGWLLVWALVPLSVAAMTWAIILFFVSFKWRVVERLDEATLQSIKAWNEILYWPAGVTVFSISLASIWAHMAEVGVGKPMLLAVYGLGVVVLLILLVHHIRSSRLHHRNRKEDH